MKTDYRDEIVRISIETHLRAYFDEAVRIAREELCSRCTSAGQQQEEDFCLLAKAGIGRMIERMIGLN